ncbi:gamma-glutamyltransferase [Candidatus Bathyarchaeota archaeon]|nr:gamma-glutamyltransferase [Candidatus Bathyarchaeota archaeon]
MATFSLGKGMVVSTDRYASWSGIEILKKGGNAIDAAVSVGFTMAVTYPSCGNIGGSGFMLYHGSDGEKTSFDFRSIAPLNAKVDMFKNSNTVEPEGILTVGVPGTVAGMQLAHNKLGKLPWSQVLEPAIRYAEEGFPVNIRLYNELNRNQKWLRNYPSSTEVFFKGEEPYKPGEILIQKDLGKTLRRIQSNGADDFYRGETAKLIVKSMEENGGLITIEDLEEYSAIEREPLHGNYRGFDVYTIAPPSSGITLLEMLNILEGYDLKKLGHYSGNYLHILTEAMILCHNDRLKYIGDPEFNQGIPLEKLGLKEYASTLRNKIDPDKSMCTKQVTRPDGEKNETTHYSVADHEGNAVSVTYTLNGDFGSYIIPKGTGVFVNNDMIDFDRAAPNMIQPGKRPRSSMIPTIISKDNKPFLVLGSPGGSTIPSVVLQIILNFIDFKMSLMESVSNGRMYRNFSPDVTLLEKGCGTALERQIYADKGHKIYDEGIAKQNNVPFRDPQLGNAMCIYIDNTKNSYWGAADPRSGDPSAFGIN